MSDTTFPPSQHWTTAGFRITVMFYKRDNPGSCATCGAFPARHAVWAEGRGEREGWRGDSARFCDEHRPPRGPLPPLDYVRLVQGMGLATPGPYVPRDLVYERTEPWPGQSCSACGAPPVFRADRQCPGCDDPAMQYTTQRHAIRAEGVTVDPPVSHHRPHSTGIEYRCPAHPCAGSATA